MDGKEALSIGYGLENPNDILSYGNMTIQSYQDCNSHYWALVSTLTCAGPKAGEKAVPCLGDSGGILEKILLLQCTTLFWFFSGPLVRMYGDYMKILALTSFILEEKCAITLPTYYTKVTPYIPWILSFASISGLKINFQSHILSTSKWASVKQKQCEWVRNIATGWEKNHKNLFLSTLKI